MHQVHVYLTSYIDITLSNIRSLSVGCSSRRIARYLSYHIFHVTTTLLLCLHTTAENMCSRGDTNGSAVLGTYDKGMFPVTFADRRLFMRESGR